MAYSGRKKIFTDVSTITRENVAEVLRKAVTIHSGNRAEIEYLYNYYRGEQPILSRTKDVRPEICNKVVENRANEIVSFKVGYLLGEPVQYVSNGDDADLSEKISRLNTYMVSEDKAAKDKELADWSHICGTSFRMVLPDSEASGEEDEAPFEVYTLDPRYCFVVYHNSLGEPPVMAVKFVETEAEGVIYSIYTKDRYFEIKNEYEIIEDKEQILGIPIIEYPLNNARLGAFEIVLPLLDAINTVDSNRMDGVEQFIQALMLFHNVDISSEDYKQLRDEGAIKFKDVDPNFKADIDYLTAELNQAQTQTLIDHLYDTVLTICGMPNRNGGSSTSDTGSAVIMRDGWSAAEARAKDTELMFKKSEKEFLKLALRICDDLSELGLKMSSIEIRFTRYNYENISEKVNVLVTMLNNPKIAPQLGFIHCGLFSDPQIAYNMSMAYVKEQEEKAAQIAKEGAGNEPGNQSVTEGGTGDQ